jgi:hypothetical protein
LIGFQVIDEYAKRQDNDESDDGEENTTTGETEKKLQLPITSSGECGDCLAAVKNANDAPKQC